MKVVKVLAGLGLAAAVSLTVVSAEEASHPAVKARKGLMQLYAVNLGQLGAMAKGSVEYDAAKASAAANNLVLLTQLNGSALWPQGTDNASKAGTRALPAIWENFPDVGSKAQALASAAAAMQGAAGTDLDSLRGAMGAVGGACGACHKAYRAAE